MDITHHHHHYYEGESFEGDGIRKGTLSHVEFYKKKRKLAVKNNDKKKHDVYHKKHIEALKFYNETPYILKKDDKEHQKKLRLARKERKKTSLNQVEQIPAVTIPAAKPSTAKKVVDVTIETLTQMLSRKQYKKFFDSLMRYKNYDKWISKVHKYLDVPTNMPVNPMKLFFTADSKALLKELYAGLRKLGLGDGRDAIEKIYNAMVFLATKYDKNIELDTWGEHENNNKGDAFVALERKYKHPPTSPQQPKKQNSPVIPSSVSQPKPTPQSSPIKSIEMPKNQTVLDDMVESLVDGKYEMFVILLTQDDKLKSWVNWIENKIEAHYKKFKHGMLVPPDIYYTPASKKFLNDLFTMLIKHMKPKKAIEAINNGTIELLESLGGERPNVPEKDYLYTYQKNLPNKSKEILLFDIAGVTTRKEYDNLMASGKVKISDF